MGKKIAGGGDAPKISMVPISTLETSLRKKNPRVHPKRAIEKLAGSIKRFGWTNPVLVDAEGLVLAGHARIAAARKAGVSEIPVIQLPLSGTQAEAYVIADNRLAEDTEWEPELLSSMLEELSAGLNLDTLSEMTGFEPMELDKILGKIPLEEAEEPAEKAKKPLICPNCGHEFD